MSQALFLTPEHAAELAGYLGPRARARFAEWARRACIPTARRGRRVLYMREDVIAARERRPPRHDRRAARICQG